MTTIEPPEHAERKTPLVFIHGGAHTGACYLATPDGRAGWATFAAASGRTSYVIDWPGHGKSAYAQPLQALSLQDVADEIAVLLDRLGRVILVTHSMGGVVGWRVAELRPHNVAAIVAIAPGPPANLQPPLSAAEMTALRVSDDRRYAELGRPQAHPLDGPNSTPRDIARAMWANSERFPHDAFDAYLASLVPESPRALNERANLDGSGVNISGPDALREIPIVVITGDQDPRHPRVTDAEIAAYFGADFIWLADRGLRGHGHLMMIEHGNDVIAGIFLRWLDERGL